ncbi:MAG: hypothetical protein COA49_07295 [Bacteroidetes bacterium]|nr:MAG: hypothetical protein COA49_07295 [Bacteroidota bacterium]
MSRTFSEDAIVEQPAMDILSQDLAWEVANVFEGETFGASGTIGRDSQADVLLKHRFLNAVQSINPDLPEIAFTNAFEVINSKDTTRNTAELNLQKYEYLKEGIPVSYKDAEGEVVLKQRVKVFDFDIPENNNFIAVQQLWVEGKSKRMKRPDVVGFVNGIPLVFMELKKPSVKLRAAYEQNLKDYKNVIPHMFHCNAVIILSNGLESKIGSITSKFEHFSDWKRIAEEEEGIVSLDTMVKGVCEKGRLLDLFENFILFNTSIGTIVKLVARNHQFIGVNKAIAHFKKAKQHTGNGVVTSEDAQRLGVFWHTQGSGKSYSMVFLTQKILRVFGGGYTFLLITDRKELDKQIYGTFTGVGAVNDKDAHATDGAHLKELLKTDKRYIFSLIQKFNFEEELTKRDNIIVISDEAHRTQAGSLAMNMRKALPNASFIGFTGTPLFKDDELTRKIFGEYVSKYDFKRSIEDGATVPLYYENRGEKLQLDNPQINQDIREAIEAQELDSDQEDKLKRLFAKEYPILTSEKRLRAIAKDVVRHFNSRGYKGKAMFVALDKVTTVKMYNFITEERTLYIQEQQEAIAKLSDPEEIKSQEQALKWAEETEFAVVVSNEQNEISKFKDWGLDIEPHRLKMNTRDLATEFKDEENPFRFAIVCAMWITGFDVPSLSTMYIDKPLKSHTLMQTIARANRVHSDKNNGLLVDYIETYKALLEALAIYGDSDSKGGDGESVAPVRPIEELVNELEEVLDAVEVFLVDECKFKLSKIVDAPDKLHQLQYLQEGVNAIVATDDTKAKFGVLARELFKKYKALMPDKSIYKFQPKRDAINALYATITAKVEQADITYIVRQVQQVVNESIATYNVALDKIEGYGEKIDISGLDFKKIEAEFLKLKGKENIAVQSLKSKVEKKLNRMLKDNPLRIDFYERYQEIIDDYNRGKDYKALKEIFDEMVVLFGELSEEGKRAERENLEEDELLVFDMLCKEKKITDKEKATVKEAACSLLERLKNNEFKVVQWTEKTQTSSAVKRKINDFLFKQLPHPAYEDKDISLKTELLFTEFKTRYGNFASVAA